MASTDIIVVLDASGSMKPLVADVVGGYNHLIEEQRKQPGDAYVTLWTFDALSDSHDDHKYIHQRYQAVRLPNVEMLTTDGYYLGHGGCTALLDAVGNAITRYDALPIKADKSIFVINTDGEENRSREYTFEQIKLIDEHTAKGWAFVFLGANNSEWQGAKMGATSSARYDATSKGVKMSYGATSANIALVRASSAPASVTTAGLDWNSTDQGQA